MQPKLQIAFGSLQSGRRAARGHVFAQKQKAAAVETCLCLVMYMCWLTLPVLLGRRIIKYLNFLKI